MIDQNTQRLRLPLPHVSNALKDDVRRLTQALTMLDASVATIGSDGKVPAQQLPAVAILDKDGKVPLLQLPAVATLGKDGKVPMVQLPPVATLGSDGKVTKEQLPAVAILGKDGKVPKEQLPPVAILGNDGKVPMVQLPPVATLGSDGKIPMQQLPAIAISESFAVASEAAMLALQAQIGDIAIRSDVVKTYILAALPASKKDNWKELLSAAVTTVNGRIGAVKVAEAGANSDITSLKALAGPLRLGSSAQADNEAVTLAQLKSVSTSSAQAEVPVGVPLPYPLAVPAVGWLKCNGAAFDKRKYPKLALAYPSGVLPDLRGEFVRGWDDGRGVDRGRAILSAQNDAFQDHFHSLITKGGLPGDLVSYTDDTGLTSNGDDFLIGGGLIRTYPASRQSLTRTAVETRPRNIAFNYIVRAA